jgi:hypothetical protein
MTCHSGPHRRFYDDATCIHYPDVVRCENAEDTEERSTIRSIDEAAFGWLEEADLVDTLLMTPARHPEW